MGAMRPLSEAECYLRCYGSRGSEVRVLPHSGYDSDPRHDPSEAGERLRRLLELRIDAREPEAA
jgi:hypothetical protein